MIKNFNRRPSKGCARKFSYINKELSRVRAEMGTQSAIDEVLMRAADSLFPPRKTSSEGWQAVARLALVCATIVATFWVLK